MVHEIPLFPERNGSKNIPFMDLTREYVEIRDEIDSAFMKVLESGIYIGGRNVENFEKEFASYVGTRYAVSVNSGSDALFLSIGAMGIGPGDEVITVSNTYVSTVDAIVRNGARPVFADIDPSTYNIDPEDLRKKITRKTKAILPVHLYGLPAAMDEIMETAHLYGLKVIEDSCQAHGAEFRGRKAGSMGDAATFSFYPTKNIGSYGDSGIIVTKDEDIYRRLLMFRNYGQSSKYHHDMIGINSRMDEIQAAALSVKLTHLDGWIARRRKAAALYSRLLEDSAVRVPVEPEGSRHAFHIYAIRSSERDNLAAKLSSRGVQTIVHYPVPVHRQLAYRNIAGNEKIPVTERISREVLSLPLYPQIREEEIEYIAEVIKNA